MQVAPHSGLHSFAALQQMKFESVPMCTDIRRHLFYAAVGRGSKASEAASSDFGGFRWKPY
jgi:hypothetical protein